MDFKKTFKFNSLKSSQKKGCSGLEQTVLVVANESNNVAEINGSILD